MAVTGGFFHDAACTQPIESLNELVAVQDGNNVLGPVTKPVWLLPAVSSGNVLEVSSDPGVDPVQISVYDAATGSGIPATDVKLALSTGALATAVGGAPLDLAPTLTGGVANAVQFYVRISSAVAVVGNYTDLSLRIENPYEHPA